MVGQKGQIDIEDGADRVSLGPLEHTPPCEQSPDASARSPAPGNKGTYGGLSANERAEERRRRLVAAALAEFGTNGYSATTIAEVCRRAGVATSHFYAQFSTREALLRAVHDQLVSGVVERVRSGLAHREWTPLQRVRASTAAYFNYMTEDPCRARVYAIECVGVSSAFEAYRRESRRAITGLTTRSANRVRPENERPHISYELLSTALAGASIAMLAEWTLASPRPSLDEIVEHMARLWYTGLGLGQIPSE